MRSSCHHFCIALWVLMPQSHTLSLMKWSFFHYQKLIHWKYFSCGQICFVIDKTSASDRILSSSLLFWNVLTGLLLMKHCFTSETNGNYYEELLCSNLLGCVSIYKISLRTFANTFDLFLLKMYYFLIFWFDASIDIIKAIKPL